MKHFLETEELISKFSACCDEMINSKFILADNKVSNILKAVASSGQIYRLFSDIFADFDFDAEFSKCKTPNSFNRTSLRFPAEKRKFVAIIFTLLVEFDAKRRDLLKFLSEYYYSEDGINESYTVFVKTVIYTFKNYVLFLLDNGEEEPEEVKVAEDYFNLSDNDDDGIFTIGQNELLELIGKVREIINLVSLETSLNIAEREEILIVTEGLSNAIMTKNDKLIRITWIGVKNTLKMKKIFEDKVNEVGQTLIRYWDI